MRYMGTKRQLVPFVQDCLDGLERRPRRFVDLFAGTAAMAAGMAGLVPVTCADALEFPALLARPRFLPRDRKPLNLDELAEIACSIARPRLRARAAAIRVEEAALVAGFEATRQLISSARHVGNDVGQQQAAHRAARAGEYSLVTRYFARGYYSTAQAVWLDAYRQAIDSMFPDVERTDDTAHANQRDVALASWIAAAGRVANSPGHTAQFLQSSNPASHVRVRQAWSRSVSDAMVSSLAALAPLGDAAWRRANRVVVADAVAAGRDHSDIRADAVVYADPPYTKDHYSRYYHVLETLLRYDYPTSTGVGRVRNDRHLSDFCYRSKAAHAFGRLGARVAISGSPLLVSYPSSGLISSDELYDALTPYGHVRQVAEYAHSHSTMGGSKGLAAQPATECLYLLVPR